MKKMMKNLAVAGALVCFAFAVQAQTTTTTTKAGAPTQTTAATTSTKSLKMKDVAKSNPDAGKMKQEQTPTSTGVTNNTVAQPNVGVKSAPSTGTKMEKDGRARPEESVGKSHGKKKYAKTHVPRGRAYGWHRNHDATRSGSK
jgi:hypothetical protein